MIITNVCLLLEALSIVICLHHLYGEKFRLDIATVCLLAVDMIMMQAIDYFEWPSVWSVLIYFVVAIYCVIKFGTNIKALIINTILYMIIICSMQFLSILFLRVFCNEIMINEMEMMISNGVIFLIIFFVLSKCKLNKLSEYLQDKEIIFVIILNIVAGLIGFCIICFKKENNLEVYKYLFLFLVIIIIELLAAKIGKYKLKSKEIEIELKMHKLYEDSFYNLIDDIRLKQHEFDNHINAIYSQHYICSTFDELVKAQEDYCHVVRKENQYNKLLSKGNPIIIGFLYGKFLDINKKGIEVIYHVDIADMAVGVPIYKIVEILGNLIDNAVEAVEKSENVNKIYVKAIEIDNSFSIEVRNESSSINFDKLDILFEKNYSSKGENRGLGLFNINQICDEYKLKIECRNLEVENSNWISFCISK